MQINLCPSAIQKPIPERAQLAGIIMINRAAAYLERLKFEPFSYTVMLYIPKVLILLVLILNLTKTERVFYLPFDIPGTQMAATIPPFGIFFGDEYRNEGDVPGSILRHEKVHWEQYRKMGLIRFYYRYMTEYIRHGRIHHWMEEEARRLSNKPITLNCHTHCGSLVLGGPDIFW